MGPNKIGGPPSPKIGRTRITPDLDRLKTNPELKEVEREEQEVDLNLSLCHKCQAYMERCNEAGRAPESDQTNDTSGNFYPLTRLPTQKDALPCVLKPGPRHKQGVKAIAQEVPRVCNPAKREKSLGEFFDCPLIRSSIEWMPDIPACTVSEARAARFKPPGNFRPINVVITI